MASSSMAVTTSVLRTLWIHGTCLSPIPSMRWPPKPDLSRVGHCRASAAVIRQPGNALPEVISGGQRAPGAGGSHPGGEAIPGATDPLEDRFGGRSRHRVVPQVVPELVELIEDDGLGPGAPDLPAHVEDLLDIALASGGGDDLGPDLFEPVEALPAHLLGKNRHRLAAQQSAVEGSAAAEVAGGGPHRLVPGRVELAR